jgi:ZIP family zinc transporter
MDVIVSRAGSTAHAAATVSAGVVLGALSIWLVPAKVPHEHFVKGPEGRSSVALSRQWLFVIGFALHTFPEGMSVGVAFGPGDRNGRARGRACRCGGRQPQRCIVALGSGLFGGSHAPRHLRGGLPETHRRGVEHRATFRLILGFIVMMMLDTMLG